jgi:UPF0755 protein
VRGYLLIAGGVVLLGIVATLGFSARGLWTPAQPGGPPRVLQIAPGDTLSAVAQRLQDEDLLPDRPLFGPRVLVAFARLVGFEREIKSGEYDVDPGTPPIRILEQLVSGSIKTHAVTLPEGLRLDEIAPRLEAAGIIEAERFLERARDPGFARSLEVEAPTLEGYLYPETYRFRKNASAEEVLRRMVEELRARWTEADEERFREAEMTLHEVLTLASIVEKESAVAAERRLIAAVFVNRLQRRMRLQSDPTVIYGILQVRGEFDGNIRHRDLRTDTPYNTYTRGGLPPGPIASTTIESIRAVLEPERVPYLYFVSRNDGTHVFSKTLRQHNEAVYRYQKRGRGGGPS